MVVGLWDDNASTKSTSVVAGYPLGEVCGRGSRAEDVGDDRVSSQIRSWCTEVVGVSMDRASVVYLDTGLVENANCRRFHLLLISLSAKSGLVG